MKEASHKQVNFIKNLLDEREMPEAYERIIRQATDMHEDGVEAMPMKEARGFIDSLLKLPRKACERQDAPQLPDVPAGHYALVEDDKTVFFKVDRPQRGKWAGWTFLAQMQGENHAPIKDRARKREILERIAEDVTAAARRYGHHMNHCGFCKKDLTDQFSRFYGVGPVCRRNHGMPISEADYRRQASPTALIELEDWLVEDARINGKSTKDEVEDIWAMRLQEKALVQAAERREDERVAREKMARDKALIAHIERFHEGGTAYRS